MSNSYKPNRAIIHIDGDAFFAYCEVAQNERLRGKPVVTGQEKGMAIAVSYEAKALGVSRGMLMSDIRKLIPDVIILPGNYDLYKVISRRMYTIVKRYAPRVEEYSVDECFADISEVSNNWDELVAIAHNVKRDLEQDLGMTFSLGLGPTKTLAKVASKWKKPAGFTAIYGEPGRTMQTIEQFLKEIPIGAVWGIGRSLSLEMQKLGIKTAFEFTQKSQIWVEEHFSKPTQVLWYELRGIPMLRVGQGNTEKHKSIRATRTFRPPSKDKQFILSELSRNAEKACARLRKYELQTRNVYFYLKTQTFTYKGFELKFSTPITTPSEIMNAVRKNIDAVFRKNTEYRASGIVLNAISPTTLHQADLFGFTDLIQSKNYLYEKVDTLYKKYPGILFLASSMQSRKLRKRQLIKRPHQDITDICLRLGIPYWGEAY
jgi:DNA polymerase-4/DNA polymerase V